MNLSLEEWVSRMRNKGHMVIIDVDEYLPLFCCTMYKTREGDIVDVFSGVSRKSVLEAIEKCRDKFGMSNIMEDLDQLEVKDIQKANLKEVKRILGL